MASKRKGAKKPAEAAFEWRRDEDGRLVMWIGEFALTLTENGDGSWVSHLAWRGGRQIDVVMADSETTAKGKALQMLAEKLARWRAQLDEAMARQAAA